MIRVLLYDNKNHTTKAGGKELVDVWRQNSETFVWLDCSDEPVEEERELLQEAFGLHKMAIQDAQRARHPPKLEAFDDFTFILLKGLSADAADLHFATFQLAIFVGERFIISRHSEKSPGVEALYDRARNDAHLMQRGPEALALRLSRLSVDRYIRMLLDLEPRLEALEEEIMQDPDDSMLAELLKYKTELKKFRRVFLYHQQIFQELKNGDFPGIGLDRVHEINDVYEQLERASSLAGLYYELASDLADGYISIASHRLNQIMKILTVVMAIFVPLSFLAGIYGMNFENMPELHSKSGYFILLGIMFLIATLLLMIFRKKRWL